MKPGVTEFSGLAERDCCPSISITLNYKLALIAMTWPYVSFDLIEFRIKAEKSIASLILLNPTFAIHRDAAFNSEFAAEPLFITPHGALMLQSIFV